ncbi:MAG: type II toxin-antitoxin system HicB family antitoxin [Candidatus Kerfeldbacteria bacterium]|nr:type II toxin-antitoxin system HicB family antitoxin [Candidatus Kerfeldbacteria bacterium]
MKHKLASVQYKVPVTFFKENDIFVAYSAVLDLSTSGKTFEQAQSRFEEAAEIFFEETIEHGTLDEVLSNLGWTKVRQQWMPPVEVAHSSQLVSIPQIA